MASDNEIRPAARTQFGAGQGAAGYPPPGDQATRQPPERRRRRLDEVVVTEPGLAALRLLRHRILERTREELGLPKQALQGIGFAPSLVQRADVFMGRLLSDQNLLASRRRQSWDDDRIAAALEEGMTSGLAETLEVLHDVGALDAESWGLVCAALEEFQRKVCATRA